MPGNILSATVVVTFDPYSNLFKQVGLNLKDEDQESG